MKGSIYRIYTSILLTITLILGITNVTQAFTIGDIDLDTGIDVNLDHINIDQNSFINSNYYNEIVDPRNYTGVGTNEEIRNNMVLKVDENSNPHMLYLQKTTNINIYKVKYAEWTGTEWSLEDIYTGEVKNIAMDIDSNNNPYITFFDKGNDRVLYGYKSRDYWIVDTVKNDINPTNSNQPYDSIISYPSIAVDNNNGIHIVFSNVKINDDHSNKVILQHATLDQDSWIFENIRDGDLSSYQYLNSYITFTSTNDTNVAYLMEYYDALYDKNYNSIIYSYIGYSNSWTNNLIVKEEKKQGKCVTLKGMALDSYDYPYIIYGYGESRIDYAYFKNIAWVTKTLVDEINNNKLVRPISIEVNSNNDVIVAYEQSDNSNTYNKINLAQIDENSLYNNSPTWTISSELEGDFTRSGVSFTVDNQDNYHLGYGLPNDRNIHTLHYSAQLPEISLSVDSVDFGEVGVNGQYEKQVTISNNGYGNLKIDSVSLLNLNDFGTLPSSGFIDTNPSNLIDLHKPNSFSLSTDLTGQIIEPGESAAFNILFSPTMEKEYGTKVIIKSSDIDEHDYIVDISGTGIDSPVIDIGESSIDYGTININEQVEKTITISNNGTGNLLITAIEGLDLPFKIIEDNVTNIPIASGDSGSFKVQFHPLGNEEYSDDLIIHSNDPGQSSSLIHVEGVGYGRSIINLEVSNDPSSYKSRIPFGEVNEGNISEREINIVNSGDCDIDVTTIVPPDSSSPFSILTENVSNSIIKPGEAKTITVHFAPLTKGEYKAYIKLHISPPRDLTFGTSDWFDITLEGTGLSKSGVAVKSGDTVDFGDIEVGGYVEKEIYIDNLNSLNSPILDSQYPFSITKYDVYHKTITIRFDPTEEQIYNGVLKLSGQYTLEGEDAYSPTPRIMYLFTVNLTGKGIINEDTDEDSNDQEGNDVDETNNPPVINLVSTIQVLVTDPEGDIVSLELGDDAPNFVTLNGNYIEITPNKDEVGTYTFTIYAYDDKGNATSKQITITSFGKNNIPTIQPIKNQTVIIGETRKVDIETSDPDGDQITLSLSDNAPNFVSLKGKTLIISSEKAKLGEYHFKVYASDGRGGQNTQDITIIIISGQF